VQPGSCFKVFMCPEIFLQMLSVAIALADKKEKARVGISNEYFMN
jgi:hypothetical protein